MIETVFVDTGAWAGFFDRRDALHAAAVAGFEQAHRERLNLMTTDYVLAETVTLLRSRAGLDAALRAWRELQDGGPADLLWVDARHVAQARAVMQKYRQVALSAVDSVTIAVMREFGIARILTFDDDFRRAGYTLLPSGGQAT